MITVKVEPLDRDIALILNETLGPQARSKIIADHARAALREGQDKNRRVLGRTPPHKTFVDGAEAQGGENSVRPDGRIVYEFELVSETLVWIGEMLTRNAPFKSGRFRAGFRLYADGSEVPIGKTVPPAQEYVFLNIEPYSRKIERGLSPQAPDGVFEAVAAMARGKFGNLAKIGFSFRTPTGTGISRGGRSNRTPAIIVTVR